MENNKYNVFEKQNEMEVRNAQIVYLHYLGYTAKDITKWVDLAVSTIRSYIKKFSNLLTLAKKIFGTAVKKAIEKVKTKTTTKNLITFECEPKKGDCAYIIEYFDSQKNFVFLKVGMTNNIYRRISEHLRDYTKKGFDTTYAVVKKLYYAEDEEDALTLENLLRKHFKAIPNCGFIKRDRFNFVRYNEEEFQKDSDTANKIAMFAV